MALIDTLRTLHEFTKEYSLGGWFGDSDPGTIRVVTKVTEFLSFLNEDNVDTILDGVLNDLISELVAFMRSRFTFQTDSTTHQLIEPVQPRDLSQGYFAFLTQALPEEDGTIASHTLMEALIADGCDEVLKASLKVLFNTATLNAMLETCVLLNDNGDGVEFDQDRRDQLIAFLLLFFSEDELQAAFFDTAFGEIFLGNTSLVTIIDDTRYVTIHPAASGYELRSSAAPIRGEANKALEERWRGFQHLEPFLALIPDLEPFATSISDEGVMSAGGSPEDLRLTVLSRLKVIITNYAWGRFSSPRADSRATRAVACVIESGDIYPLKTTLAHFHDLSAPVQETYHNIAKSYLDNLNWMPVFDARLVAYVELIHFYACRLFLADVDEVSKLYDLLNKDSFALRYLYHCVGIKNPAVIEKLRDSLLAELQDGSGELVFNRMLSQCGDVTSPALWLFIRHVFVSPNRVYAFLYRDDIHIESRAVVGIIENRMGFEAAVVSRAARFFTQELTSSRPVLGGSGPVDAEPKVIEFDASCFGSVDTEVSEFGSRDSSSKLLSNEDFLAEVIQLSDLLARIEEDIAEQQHRKAPPGTPKLVTPHASTPIFEALIGYLQEGEGVSSDLSDSDESRDPFTPKAKRKVTFDLPPDSPAKLQAIQEKASDLEAKLAGEDGASTSVLTANSIVSPPRVDYAAAKRMMAEMIEEAKALAAVIGADIPVGQKMGGS